MEMTAGFGFTELEFLWQMVRDVGGCYCESG
ncbi:hypothetical protein CgS9114_10682 [Corynebacterium glutamicum S9114]|nr:hypothetical protein CgS9114_10682 [Corynebacterium glutamicum S9114]